MMLSTFIKTLEECLKSEGDRPIAMWDTKTQRVGSFGQILAKDDQNQNGWLLLNESDLRDFEDRLRAADSEVN